MYRDFKALCGKSLLWIGVMVFVLEGCMSSPSDLTVFYQPQSSIERYGGHGWSPNGEWLASESSDTTQLSLFHANGQLANELRLGCDLGSGYEDFSWLADGRLSCLTNSDPPTVSLLTLTAQGKISKESSIIVSRPSDSIMYGMQWNPHHFWLATIADQIPGAISPTLYITDLQGHQLISPMNLTTQDGEELTWSPDGTILAIVDHNGNILLWKVQQSNTGRLMLKQLRLLKAETTTGENIAWSPSGHWLVCRHGTYQGEDYLFLLATDGSGKQVKLTSSDTDGQLYDPAWSPDGKQLIVGRVSDGALMSLNIAQLLKDKGVKP